MLRTSSQEGGLQQRTESPKATSSGVPNGFVRPVAVASIFCPALGGNSGVSAADGKPAVPEKRKSSATKEKGFGSSLSSEEFSRRRQSFNTTTAISLGQNLLKGDRSSPSRTLPDSESVQEHIDEVLTLYDKCDEGTEKYSEVQNADFKKSKDNNRLTGTTTTAKSASNVEKGNLKTERKNTENVSKPSKSDKSSMLGSSPDVSKVASSSGDNVPCIQNGILNDSEIATLTRRPRSRNSGAADCVQKYDTPQTERRRRNKPLLSTCSESVSDSTRTETVHKDTTSSSRSELSGTSTFSNETAANKIVGEYVSGTHQPERRRRDKTPHSVSTEENRNVKDTQVVGKDLSSQKVPDTGCNLVYETNSAIQTKSELNVDAGKPDLLGLKADSTEASDNQSVSKFRTCRRTSDVIAAKIQNIFSKSDKASTLPSNKLSSSKSKSGTSATEIKEEKSETGSTEKNTASSEVVTAQKVSEVKTLDKKEGSTKVSSNDLNVSGETNLSKKSDYFAKKQQNVKCPEASVSSENKLKQVTKTQSETGNSAVKSDTSVDKEKFLVRNRVKDSKCSQKSDDTFSPSTRPSISTVTGNEKKSVNPEIFPRATEKKEVSCSVKESVSNSFSSKQERPAPSPTKRPSINFFIAEVSVENAPQQPQKISTGKISPLQITAVSVEEKSYVTQKLHTSKPAGSELKVKDLTPSPGTVASKFSDKTKTAGKLLPLKEEKVPPANQLNSNQILKSSAVESTSCEAKISEKGQVGKTLLLKEEKKVLLENVTAKHSQAQKSTAVHTTSETKEEKVTKFEVVNLALKSSEKTKAGKTALSKEANKVSENLLEKSGQNQKSVVVESRNSETKTVKITKSDTGNSGAVVSTLSEKDNVIKTVLSKEGNKLQPQNLQEKSSQAQKSAVENSSSETKTVKINKSDIGNSGAVVSTLSEKDKVGKTVLSKEGNKLQPQNLQGKSSHAQKSVAVECSGSETKTVKITKSDIGNSGAVVSTLSEKDKVGKTVLSKEGNKLQPQTLLEKNNQEQKSVAVESSETKTVKITKSDIGNSGAVVSTSSEKDKLGKTVLSKEGNKVQPQNLQEKNSQVQKVTAQKNACDDTKASSTVLGNSGSPVVKAAEKDKLGKPLLRKEENRGTAESTQEKSSQVQKAGADISTSGGTKVRALKLSEKDKVDITLPLQEKNRLVSENSRNKDSEVKKAGADTKTQSSTSSELAKTEAQTLTKFPEKDKLGGPVTQKEGNKISNEVLKQKTGQLQKSADVKTSIDTKSQNLVTCEVVNSETKAEKLSEKDSTVKNSAPKEGNKVTENLQQQVDKVEKICSEEGDKKGSELVNSETASSKRFEQVKVGQGSLQPKENKTVPENLNKRSDIFLKWAAKESSSGAVKVKTGPAKNSVVSDMPCKQSDSTSKSIVQKNKSEMPSENIKQIPSSVQKVNEDKPIPNDTNTENATTNNASVNSSKVGDGKEQPVEVKTKHLNSAEAIQNQEETNQAFAKVKKRSMEELKSDETAKYADVKKFTTVKKTVPSANELSSTESLAKLPPAGKRVEHSALNSQSPTIKRSEKLEEAAMKELKQLPMHSRSSSALGTTQKLIGGKTESNIQRDDQKSVVTGQGEKIKPIDTILTSSVVSTENTCELKNHPDEIPVTAQQPTKDFLVSASETKDQMSSADSYFRSRTQEIYRDARKISGTLSTSEKDWDDLDDITNMDMVSSLGISSVFNPEFPGRSYSYSKLETPRPPERKRSGFLRETSTLTSPPPRAPLRTMSRTGSLKRPDDSRFPMERTLAVLRSASHSVLGPTYTPQRISYTEMLSKLGTCGPNVSSITSNRKFGTSQVSELWADLSEEQANGAHTSEMLESETSERMRLEKEVQELQSRYSQMQQKSDKMEMEMMEARVYRATEVNGDISEDEENDAAASIYKQKYERTVRDMEIMKRRLQQQHEEEIEQSLMLKKAADKRLTEALEDVEEERQVVNQWKRKAQKLGAELQDLRLMLEEQMARNGELEKKQRRFDAELSAAQEEIRKEHQLREKLTRDKDQAMLEKYSLEQELQATRLDMDMQHEKITLLNREIDELSLSSKGEEEVTQLKRAKQELERRTRDQEEELEELAGQVQMLEQSKLRLEMSLEKLRQEHRRESSVRDEEIEEIRACSSKKIKNLEAQLENEQEERHQLVKQKHELERRIIELSDQPPPQDPEIERRLRRDLKRTKALLRDAQSMLEHMRDGQANKTLIRQLKNQLEDAEFTKSVAIKARQSAELELQELQSQLEEVTRTKNDIESRCLQLSREKSAIQTQLEEMEEEMAEVMKKYKAAVAQMSIDQKSLAEQTQQICELETERLTLKDQLAEVSTKLDHISVQTEDSARVHRLDGKVRDLESKLELEQTTRSRLEHQIGRLKEQCDRSREECDSLRNKELQAQEGTRRLQRQLRELREDYAALQQKESEAYRKQHELEMALENTEADLQVTKNDLRLACQRIQDLQSALEDDLDSGTDVPDESGSDTDSSLDVSVLSRQCLTPLQRSDSVSSNTSIGSDRQFRALSHSQDLAFFSRMMQTRTSMDFLI